MKLVEFFNAVKAGQLDSVKEAVRLGIDYNSKDESGHSALDIACDKGHEELVEYFLKLSTCEPSSKPKASIESDDSICIVGFSSIFPQSGFTSEGFWETLCSKHHAITEVPSERWSIDEYYDADKKASGKMYTKKGGFLNHSPYNFDASFFNIVPKEAQIMDPQQRVMLEAVWYAMEHAGINPLTLRDKSVGVFCGIMTHDYADMLIQSGIEHNNFIGTGNGASVLSGRISYFFGFQGPSLTIDTACSSSLVTTHQACTSLRLNECDVAFSAGVNLMLAPGVTINCCKANMLSPDGTCKTFSADADGYGRGEGCGVVILKRYRDALKDNNKIYGIIRGSAVNQDGATSGLTVPNKQAQINVIHRALQQAHLSTDDIDHIEMHGTGTSTGDPIEVNSLKEVFAKRNKHLDPVLISSVKSYVGHLEAAAGMAGIIKVLLSLENQSLPALPIVGSINPKINLESTSLAIMEESTPWQKRENHIRRAGISSFGFSGTNAHVIIEESPELSITEEERLRWQWVNEELLPIPAKHSLDSPLQLLTLSAKSSGALKKLVDSYLNWLSSQQPNMWLDIVYSSNVSRQHFPLRLTVRAHSIESCLAQLNQIQHLSKPEKKKSKPFIGIVIPSFDTIQLSSFQKRFKEDALYCSIFTFLKESIPFNYSSQIEHIMLADQDVDDNSSFNYAVTKIIAVYAMYERYQRIGFALDKIDSEGSGHYLAAVLDGRLSLSEAIQLYEAYHTRNFDRYQELSQQVVIHQSNRYWDTDPEDLCQALFNQQPKNIISSQSDIKIDLTSASQQTLIEYIDIAYKAGYDINWKSYWQGSFHQHVHLPQYPFERQHYSFQPTIKSSSSNLSTAQDLVSHTKSYQLNWQLFDINNCSVLSELSPVMVFKISVKQWNNHKWHREIAELVNSMGVKSYWLISGKRSNFDAGFQIDFGNSDDWHWLFQEFKKISIVRIIDLSYLDIDSLMFEASKEDLPIFLSQQLINNHFCFNALIEQKMKCDYFVYIPEISSKLDERLAAYFASLQGQYRSVSLSQSMISMLQVPNNISDLKFALETTLTKHIASSMLKLQNNGWQHQVLDICHIPSSVSDNYRIGDNEGIIITGGLGSLGLMLTDWFAQKEVKYIALLARSFPTEEQKAKINELKKKYNTNIVVFQVDVADSLKLNTTISTISEKIIIQGVFHLAGKANIVRFNKIKYSDYEESLSAKAIGAINLINILKRLPNWPKHVVLFSSSASILPELGQTTYAAANSILDMLAARYDSFQQRVQTINWGLWGAAGIGADVAFTKRIRSGSKPLSENECQTYFWKILNLSFSQTAILNFDWQEYVKHLSLAEKTLASSCISSYLTYPTTNNEKNQRSKLTAMPTDERRNQLILIIKNIIKSVTGLNIDQLKNEMKFEEELAIDSNLLSEIREKLQEIIGNDNTPFAATLLFEYGSINELTDFLMQELANSNLFIEHDESPTEYIRKQTSINTTEVKIKLLQSSSDHEEPPLILIHTIMGSVFFYRPLVDFLEYKGGIYGVEDPYFSSLSKKYSSLIEMASAYAQAIKIKFSGQSVRLAGLSFAGCVAYEIAQQLIDLNGKVDNVLMFDTAMPGAGDLNLPNEHREYVMGEIADDINKYYQAAIDNNQRILNAYRPIVPKKNLRVILFKARSRDSVNKSLPSLNMECNGWLNLFCPEMYSVPGSHFSLFDRGYIHSTTQAMRFVYSRKEYYIDQYKRADIQFNRQQLLLQAAKNGDSYLVLRLLQQQVNPLTRDEEGNTPACYAALNDDLCSLAWLHYYAGSELELTSLYNWAIKGKSLKTMSYLVEHATPQESILPCLTLSMDTNKMQDMIFLKPQRVYSQREWLEILASHNASSSKINQTVGPMQIFSDVPSKELGSIASISSKQSKDTILQATQIFCGQHFKYEIICRLKKGIPNKPNLFMIHAASGLALPYSNLEDLNFGPIYGISNPYFASEDANGFDNIKQMAKHYLKRIKSIQPKGPYYFGGWSLGGIVAAAMASELEKKGEKVEWVVMIDSVNHEAKPYYVQAEEMAIDHIMNKHESINRFIGMKEAITKCYLQTSKLLHNYKAPLFSGKIFLLKAEEHEETHALDNEALIRWREAILNDPFSGWGNTFPNLEIYSIKGKHNDLFDRDYIWGVHSILQSICNNVSLEEQLPKLQSRWSMNLLKALRRQDSQLVNMLMRNPEKDYSYRDSLGNLLDFIQSQNQEGLLEQLDIHGLSLLRTTTGSTAAEVALEFGMFELFTKLSEVSNRTLSPRSLSFFLSGSQGSQVQEAHILQTARPQ